MGDLTLKVKDGEGWALSGELTFPLLSLNYRRLSRKFPKAGQWRINCSDLMRIDSSGVAFILECIRHARAHSITLKISGAPEQLSTLMALQGVSEIINPYLGS